MKNIPFGLGGFPREVDSRDYKIESFTGTAAPTPLTYLSAQTIIYMQNHQPACSSHAASTMTNILFPGITVSPEFAWKEIKLIDNVHPEDGSTMDGIFNELRDTSICDLSLMPNNSEDSVSLEDYTSPSTITGAMISNAAPRKITSYAFTNRPTFQQIKDAIWNHKVVILLVEIGDGWWTPSWEEKDILPLRMGNYVGHHFIACTGFDINYIYFNQSWSTDWGRQGVGYFNSSYIPHVIEMGIGTMGPYRFYSNLYFGMLGNPDVHALQNRLGVIPASGNFGPLTFSAVRTFQKQNNINPTGFVGPLTLAALNKI